MKLTKHALKQLIREVLDDTRSDLDAIRAMAHDAGRASKLRGDSNVDTAAARYLEKMPYARFSKERHEAEMGFIRGYKGLPLYNE